MMEESFKHIVKCETDSTSTSVHIRDSETTGHAQYTLELKPKVEKDRTELRECDEVNDPEAVNNLKFSIFNILGFGSLHKEIGEYLSILFNIVNM